MIDRREMGRDSVCVCVYERVCVCKCMCVCARVQLVFMCRGE